MPVQRGTSLRLREPLATRQRRQNERKLPPTQLQGDALFGLLPTRRGGDSEIRPNSCWKHVLRLQRVVQTAERGHQRIA